MQLLRSYIKRVILSEGSPFDISLQDPTMLAMWLLQLATYCFASVYSGGRRNALTGEDKEFLYASKPSTEEITKEEVRKFVSTPHWKTEKLPTPDFINNGMHIIKYLLRRTCDDKAFALFLIRFDTATVRVLNFRLTHDWAFAVTSDDTMTAEDAHSKLKQLYSIHM